MFGAIGKEISECVVPPPDKKLWYEGDEDLNANSLENLLADI